MCKLNRTRRGVAKSKNYIEVRLRADATYGEACDAAASTVELYPEESNSSESEEELHLALYRVDGTMIPDRPIDTETGEEESWNILNYLKTFKSFRRQGNPIKLAVGYSVKVNQLPLLYRELIKNENVIVFLNCPHSNLESFCCTKIECYCPRFVNFAKLLYYA